MRGKSVIIGFVLAIIVMLITLTLSIYDFVTFDQLNTTMLGLSVVTIILVLINGLNYYKYKKEKEEK